MIYPQISVVQFNFIFCFGSAYFTVLSVYERTTVPPALSGDVFLLMFFSLSSSPTSQPYQTIFTFYFFKVKNSIFTRIFFIYWKVYCIIILIMILLMLQLQSFIGFSDPVIYFHSKTFQK